jgi:hypothetical protein
MAHAPPGQQSLQERIRAELRDYAVVAGYLFVCIGALELYRTAILRDAGIAYSPFGFAIVKALILGKFALLGKAVGLGTRGSGQSLGWRIVSRAALFALLLVVLMGLEELVSGWLHGRSVVETVAEVGAAPLLTLFADAIILVLMGLPLLAMVEFARILGPDRLGELLRSRSPGAN